MSKKTAYVAEYESDADYHADRSRLSGSALELFRQDPRKYAAWMRGEFETEETPAMTGGSLFHGLVLEPDTVQDRFAIEPEHAEKPGKCIYRGSRDYKDWKAEQVAAGKGIVEREYMAGIEPMAKAVRATPEAMAILKHPEFRAEVALHWRIRGDGRPMRAKLDGMIESLDIVFELKTDRDPNPEDERRVRDWHDRGYHRKAFLYLDAYYQLTGRNAKMVHVFVENKGANPEVLYTETYVDSPAVQAGEIDVDETLAKLDACEKASDFRKSWVVGAPGYRVRSLPIPQYVLRQLEFAQQGPPAEFITEAGVKVEV